VSDQFIEPDWLECVRGTIFYYPAAGSDTVEPIQVLCTSVQNFWFCDKNYKSNLNLPHALGIDSGFRITRRIQNGAVGACCDVRLDNKGKPYNYLDPSRLVEDYQSAQLKLTVTRRRGFGQIALTKEFDDKTIGVFMHRGDSGADGGSGGFYLSNRKSSNKPCSHLYNKLSLKLKDKSMVITDGSNSGVEWLRKFHFKEVCGNDAYLHHLGKSYLYGTFYWKCVGWLRMRYGPTLVWGLTRI
jgi:hypothetical protein